jgi:transcription initiation factor IIE alpha subunit
MSYTEDLKQKIAETNWPIYACFNGCRRPNGDPYYEQAIGTNPVKAPSTIRCQGCGSDMKRIDKLANESS